MLAQHKRDMEAHDQRMRALGFWDPTEWRRGESGKMEPIWEPERCRLYALDYQDLCCDEKTWDFTWARVDFPTEGLIKYLHPKGNIKTWQRWWEKERESYPKYYDSLWEWVESAKYPKEIVLTPTSIWDGWHRSACSMLLQRPTVPAIFGTPKNKP